MICIIWAIATFAVGAFKYIARGKDYIDHFIMASAFILCAIEYYLK